MKYETAQARQNHVQPCLTTLYLGTHHNSETSFRMIPLKFQTLRHCWSCEVPVIWSACIIVLFRRRWWFVMSPGGVLSHRGIQSLGASKSYIYPLVIEHSNIAMDNFPISLWFMMIYLSNIVFFSSSPREITIQANGKSFDSMDLGKLSEFTNLKSSARFRG